jgi:hypothetical protein
MDFIKYIIEADNNPQEGFVSFDSSDHIRFQNGKAVSGHNYGCHRRFIIEKNIEDNEGYTVTLYNLDGVHPLWRNNIQMAPKQMKIVNANGNVFQFRGYGYDQLGAAFSDYGIDIMVDDNKISRIQLNMFDRKISIVYLP